MFSLFQRPEATEGTPLLGGGVKGEEPVAVERGEEERKERREKRRREGLVCLFPSEAGEVIAVLDSEEEEEERGRARTRTEEEKAKYRAECSAGMEREEEARRKVLEEKKKKRNEARAKARAEEREQRERRRKEVAEEEEELRRLRREEEEEVMEGDVEKEVTAERAVGRVRGWRLVDWGKVREEQGRRSLEMRERRRIKEEEVEEAERERKREEEEFASLGEWEREEELAARHAAEWRIVMNRTMGMYDVAALEEQERIRRRTARLAREKARAEEEERKKKAEERREKERKEKEEEERAWREARALEVMERRRREAEEMSRSAPRVAARVGVAPQEAASVSGSPQGAAQSSSAAVERVRRPAALTAALLEVAVEETSPRKRRGGEVEEERERKRPDSEGRSPPGTAALSIPPTTSGPIVRGGVGGAIASPIEDSARRFAAGETGPSGERPEGSDSGDSAYEAPVSSAAVAPRRRARDVGDEGGEKAMKALEERDGWDRRMRGVRGWAGMVSAWRRVLSAEDEREGERYIYRVERGLEGDVKSHKWGLAIEIAMGEVEVRKRWGVRALGVVDGRRRMLAERVVRTQEFPGCASAEGLVEVLWGRVTEERDWLGGDWEGKGRSAWGPTVRGHVVAALEWFRVGEGIEDRAWVEDWAELRGVSGYEVLREWHEKRGLVCAREGKDPEYEAGWKRTAWARQVVVEEMVEEGKESRAAQKARHKRRKEERRRKRVALVALRAGGGSAAEVERWEKVLSEGWLERLWEGELLLGVELSGRDRGVGTCPPGVVEEGTLSSVEESTGGPSGVGEEETAEAEPPREVSEAAVTPRVMSEGLEREPSSVGTERREARLSELTEGSADISAWFGGVGEEDLGLEEPQGREGAAPQGAAARPVREGIAHAGDDDLEEREEERFRVEGGEEEEEGREEDYLWRGRVPTQSYRAGRATEVPAYAGRLWRGRSRMEGGHERCGYGEEDLSVVPVQGPEFREAAIWRGIPGTWPARDFPCCVWRLPLLRLTRMRDCVSCQDTFALKGQDQAARACAYHIRVSQVKLAALPRRKKWEEEREISVRQHSCLFGSRRVRKAVALFPYGFMPCVWGEEGVELTMKVIVEGAFPGAFLEGRWKTQGISVDVTFPLPRLVHEWLGKSVRVHGDLQAFGSRPGRKQRVDWGWVPREGDREGLREGVSVAPWQFAPLFVYGDRPDFEPWRLYLQVVQMETLGEEQANLDPGRRGEEEEEEGGAEVVSALPAEEERVERDLGREWVDDSAGAEWLGFVELEGGEREWRGVEEGFALSEFATSSAGTVRVMVEAPSPTYDEEEEVGESLLEALSRRGSWPGPPGDDAGAGGPARTEEPALEVEEEDWRKEWAAAAAEREEVVVDEGGWEERVGGAADAAEVEWRSCWEAAAAEEEVAAEDFYEESATSRRVRRWW